jgi:hypothetical protein
MTTLSAHSGTAPAHQKTSTSVATELRQLVTGIEDLARQSRACSIAGPAIAALAEYLSMRAAVSETECSTHQPDDVELRARLVSDTVRHGGNLKISVRTATDGLDQNAVVRVVDIAAELLRDWDCAGSRAIDLVAELREHLEESGGGSWDVKQTLEELAGVLVRAKP